jgi:hypothetical protein
MYQRAGAGAAISPVFTIDEVITRFKKFPEIAETSAAAYETEVATYDTIPLPVPTPVEEESFLEALADAREKKLRYIQTRNDLEFALRSPEFFEDPPPADTLATATSVYTKLINAVTEHAIKLSKGQTPTQFFDPSVLTPPLSEPAPIRPKKKDLPVQPLITSMTDIRGVLQVGGFRTEAELATMSAEDQRNTLIVELTGRTNQPVEHYQSLVDRALAGAGAILVFIRKKGIRTDAEIKTVSDDDLRNTLIVEVDARTPQTVAQLQALSNLELVELALKVF